MSTFSEQRMRQLLVSTVLASVLTNPLLAQESDTDADSVPDSADNCISIPNTNQTDTDGDNIGDVCDDDSDNDGVTNADELALGIDPLKADTDGDGLDDFNDDSHVLINGQYPHYTFTVIRPGVDILASTIQVVSPHGGYVYLSATEIAGNRAVHEYEFTERTPAGTFLIANDFPVVQTNTGTLYDQSSYPFELINDNGVVSSAVVEEWSLADASSDTAAGFTFTITVSGIIDGVVRRYPVGTDTRLLAYIHLKFASDDEAYVGYEFYPHEVINLGGDRYQLSMTRALPQGMTFSGSRISLFELSDGALNLTYFEQDTDGDNAADLFDAFPNDPIEYLDTDGDGIGNNADNDNDNDGLSDPREAELGTNPLQWDTDKDGLSDGFEVRSLTRNPLFADYFVSAGSLELCAQDDQAVKCWGRVAHVFDGASDLYPFRELQLSENQICGLSAAEGRIRCWPLNGQPGAEIGTGGFQTMAVGGRHVCAVEVNGVVACFGSNTWGQSTPPSEAFNAIQLSAGLRHTCANVEGEVICWGSNLEGYLDVPDMPRVEDLSSSYYHSCAIAVGRVYCWGADDYGQSQPPALKSASAITTGRYKSCALDGSQLTCWGAYPFEPEPQLFRPSQIDLFNSQGVVLDSRRSENGLLVDRPRVVSWGEAFPQENFTPMPQFRFGDKDGDGILDDMDTDDDGDGLLDAREKVLGTDPLDMDTDRDGIDDSADEFPMDPSETLDSDGDGLGDNADIDDDNDGVVDDKDAFPNDPAASLDSDRDGYPDSWNAGASEEQIISSELSLDAFPSNQLEWADADRDGVGNNADADDDGDGVLDADDDFPLDASESIDTDGDGVGNNADTDDDGDGFRDTEEIAEGTDPLASTSQPELPSGLPVWLLHQVVKPQALSVTVSASGDDSYELYVDGQLVLSDSDWTVAESQTLNLTKGNHVIAVKGFNNANGTHPGVVIVDVLGPNFRVVSDSSWQVSLEGGIAWNQISGSLLNPAPATVYGDIYSTTWWNRDSSDTSGVSLEGSNFPLSSPAYWIWSSGLQTDAIVYFRKEFVVD